MRKLILWATIAFCFISIAVPVHSSSINPPPAANNVPKEDIYKKISSMKVKDLQKTLGRKLTIKERIGFFLFKHQVKRHANTDSKRGETALIFSIIGAVLLLVGIFVPFVILGSVIGAIIGIIMGSTVKKQNPSDKNALAAVLLGWITLGLFAILLIAAAIIVSTWEWSFF
jgi:hypothetical protein